MIWLIVFALILAVWLAVALVAEKRVNSSLRKLLDLSDKHMASLQSQFFDLQSQLPKPPERLDLIKALVHGTAGLELAKHEFRKLPALPGGWGPFELRGNALPEVKYLVFDEPSMEFVTVRAQASFHPLDEDAAESFKVVFISTITPDSSKPSETHEIAHQPEFEAPFWALVEHLYRYFPLMAENKEPARVIA